MEIHLTTPTIRLLDRRRESGSNGSETRSHSFAISAVKIERRCSFLKFDFGPRVAASLVKHEPWVFSFIARNRDEPEQTETGLSFLK